MRNGTSMMLGGAAILALAFALPAAAQVGGGNDLPSSATTPGGTGGTANTPQNNGVATGAGGSSMGAGGSSMGAGGAPMRSGGSMGTGAGTSGGAAGR